MQSSEASVIGLDRYLSILKRRWFPALSIFSLVFVLVLASSSTQKPIYQAEGKLRFKKTTATSSITQVGKDLNTVEPLGEKGSPLSTESEIIRSIPLIQETLKQLKWRKSDGSAIEPNQFLKQLTVAEVKNTDVLQIVYEDSNPEKAAKAVNTLMNVYLKNNLFNHREEAASTKEFIAKQLPDAEKAVNKADLALRQFQEINKIVALPEETSGLVTQLNDLQKQINEVRSQIANSNNQAEVLQKKLGMDSTQAALITKVNQSPAIQEVLQKLQQAQSELAQESSRFTDENPTIIDLKSKIESLKQLLNERIQQVAGANNGQQLQSNLQMGALQQQLTSDLIKLETARQGSLGQLQELSKAQNNYQKRISIIPKLEQQLRELQRKVNNSQSTYSLLSQKFEEIKIAEQQNQGNVRVVSYALEPEKPIASPNTPYIAAGMLGTIAALALIYLLEITDRSIKTIDKARETFNYPWLGAIPSLGKFKRHDERDPLIPYLVVKNNPATAASEAYRMLLSNLKFLNSDKKVKVIVVSSSTAKEGKSTVSANLATAIAQSGSKVLLIDADMPNPIQHHIWDINNERGLSNVLSQQIAPEQAIKTLMPNLEILTSGVVPPSSAALLESKRMASLIEEFAAQYEFVILDTPALNDSADAQILGRMADGILLTVKLGTINTNIARNTKQILDNSGHQVLGIVINGIPGKKTDYNQYEKLVSTETYIPNQDLPIREDLWQTIARLEREAQKPNNNGKLVSETLEKAPLDNLQETIVNLQQDLKKLTEFVNEQEDELAYQRKIIQELEDKLNNANNKERLTLEQELALELEKKKMLARTIIGQRRNLQKRQDILTRYKSVLQLKQIDKIGR
jgi:capsular exopolysaccharide synthesis family protein